MNSVGPVLVLLNLLLFLFLELAQKVLEFILELSSIFVVQKSGELGVIFVLLSIDQRLDEFLSHVLDVDFRLLRFFNNLFRLLLNW